jgi:hypothetical protein
MKIIFLVLIFLVYFNMNLFSNESDTLRKFKKYHTTVFLSTGSGFIANSYKFFDIYNKVLGGKISEFKILPVYGIGTKVMFTPEIRFGISAEFAETKINESVFQIVQTKDEKGSRIMSEDFVLRQLPVFLTAEYVPYSSWQFKTFAGSGLGVNIALTRWSENIKSSLIDDKRISGMQYNSVDLLPALKIYSGLELGFDRMTNLHFLGSLIIQFSYTHFFGGVDLYKTVRKQYDVIPQEINDTLIPVQGYLTFGIAVSFNFNRKYK